MFETRGGRSIKLSLAEIIGGPLLLFTYSIDLLSNDGLVLIFHLVNVVCLEVIHQDGKAAHDLGLLIYSFDALLTSLDVHLCADPIDLFKV